MRRHLLKKIQETLFLDHSKDPRFISDYALLEEIWFILNLVINNAA